MDDGGMKIVRPFLGAKDIRYPVVIETDALARQYGLKSTSLALLTDRSGKSAVAHAGVVD
jgi:hypothetical protein